MSIGKLALRTVLPVLAGMVLLAAGGAAQAAYGDRGADHQRAPDVSRPGGMLLAQFRDPAWRPPPHSVLGRNYYYGRRPPPYRFEPAPPPRDYEDDHINWCLNRYRSYDPRTDLFFGYDGRYHRCRSPYW